MASRTSVTNKKFLIFSVFFVSLTLLLLTPAPWHKPSRYPDETSLLTLQYSATKTPKWFDFITKDINGKNGKLKVGLINIDKAAKLESELHGLAETVTIRFDHITDDRRWEDFFPEWIDEDERWRRPTCPEIPISSTGSYGKLDVLLARVPCGRGMQTKGARDVFRLQVNLVVANLTVRLGRMNDSMNRMVYVVFIGSCGPMLEIFRCDDLLRHVGDYWIYKPDLARLEQKLVMPVGTCQVASPNAEPGEENWRKFRSHPSLPRSNVNLPAKQAYVTVLHSSETYVCGAIALAQSIIQTNSTKDLILLADDSITAESLRGLSAAGWKIKRIQRIRSPHAKKRAYNKWNYSKLRVWQLTQYEKVIFIDADLLVLKNIDHFFAYPQLTAVGNNGIIFNSGVMLVEPSECMFKTLMEKSHALLSYNGGDQGFLNEVFTWWHRWPSKLNYLKMFKGGHDKKSEVSKGVYAIHYLGMKPWMCYKDYDCNWDRFNHRPFASDSAHRRWWRVYQAMPKRLQPYCALTKKMDARLKKWRERAKNGSFPDGHWKIDITDPRRYL